MVARKKLPPMPPSRGTATGSPAKEPKPGGAPKASPSTRKTASRSQPTTSKRSTRPASRGSRASSSAPRPVPPLPNAQKILQRIPAALRGLQRADAAAARGDEERALEAEAYLELCAQVAESRAAGATFRQIAAAQGTSVSTAHRRWESWHLRAQEHETTELLRSSLSRRYEWMFSTLASELDLIRSARCPDLGDLAEPTQEQATALRVIEGGEAPAMLEGDESGVALYQRVYLVASIMRRMTEVVRRHAQVLGLQNDAGTTLNVGPGAGASVLSLTKVEAPDDRQGQEQLAEHLRDISRLVGEPRP